MRLSTALAISCAYPFIRKYDLKLSYHVGYWALLFSGLSSYGS